MVLVNIDQWPIVHLMSSLKLCLKKSAHPTLEGLLQSVMDVSASTNPRPSILKMKSYGPTCQRWTTFLPFGNWFWRDVISLFLWLSFYLSKLIWIYRQNGTSHTIPNFIFMSKISIRYKSDFGAILSQNVGFAKKCSHLDLNPQLSCKKMLTLGFEPTTFAKKCSH